MNYIKPGSAAYHRLRRRTFKAAGLCFQCGGKNRVRPDRSTCVECGKRDSVRVMAWVAKNRGKYNKTQHNWKEGLRDAVFGHYGKFCKCCGEDERKFLSIDHINGGGAAHRRSIGRKGGYPFYCWLKNQGFPVGFQILCFNCHIAKDAYGVCPHGRTIGGSHVQG